MRADLRCQSERTSQALRDIGQEMGAMQVEGSVVERAPPSSLAIRPQQARPAVMPGNPRAEAAQHDPGDSSLAWAF